MFTTHDWEWSIYTTYKGGDDSGVVYCLTHIISNGVYKPNRSKKT